MEDSWIFHGIFILNFLILATSESYYSVVAPGALKSNRKYNVIVSLHEASEQAAISVSLEGPSFNKTKVVYLKAYETVNVEFSVPKLDGFQYKLIAEGISGIQFRNESLLNVFKVAGPKIYIQTDKAIYKPGDVVQFRILLMDEHTMPLKIKEPIRVEILDGKGNRVKQFKDISLVKGIYKDKFQLSSYPVMGFWEIRVHLSGKYNFTELKNIKVQNYVLPKFSVYIKTDPYYIPKTGALKALIYGKYTFDKYVEGNATANLMESFSGNLIQQKQFYLKDQAEIEFNFNASQISSRMRLHVYLTEGQTGLTENDSEMIEISHEHYRINVNTDSIRFRDSRPYRLKASISHLNGTKVFERMTPVKMTHGSKDYQSYLDSNGEALFEFESDPLDGYTFSYKDSTATLPNIFEDKNVKKNHTDSYCSLKLMGDSPKLGIPIEIVVTSITPIPYIVYSLVAHAQIIETYNIRMQPNQRTYTIRIVPSIKMVPVAFLYVYYVRNGNYHYDEMKLKFAWEFENKITVVAPRQVEPGKKVTLNLKAQPSSIVGVLAVDLGVYLLDRSYDLKRDKIFNDLASDLTYLPFPALVYPGLLSGVVTFTNAHYEFVTTEGFGIVAPASVGPVKFRTKFPETWIFENYEISNENTQLTLNIPDTITTWRITAFTLSDITGFGIVDEPTDITTIQPFFINLNLPYSVKRGEIVAIPVIIYNYHKQFLDTEITFYNNNNEFDFMESNIFAGFRVSQSSNTKVQRIGVPANGVNSVKFYITAKQVGELNLTLVARNYLATDAIIQKLKVEPEGAREHSNFPEYISLQAGQEFHKTFTITVPSHIVPLSEFITLTVSGNTLVPTLKNLNDLVLLPTGCGEQNMVNFAPNILVLNYLRTSGNYQKQREIVKKAREFIDIGYQQQMSYRHRNGGYSVFGQRKDDEASTWLTAYVVRYFIKASKYLSVEAHIVDSGFEFLSQNQRPDGSFDFTGYLFYPAQQNRYGFTAFVLMTFLEEKKYANKYKTIIEKGLKYLSDNIDRIDNTYALSIMMATLQMAKHEDARKIFNKLQIQRHQSTDLIWWTQSDGNSEKDIEITAYILTALLDAKDHKPYETLAIFKWLTKQRNEHGGFKSTHDTVVGLQAMVKFTELYTTEMRDMKVNLKYQAKNAKKVIIKSGELMVNSNNKMILQEEELLKNTRFVDIDATGYGNALVQLSTSYHMVNNNNFKHFLIKTQPKMLNSEELLLDICFEFLKIDAAQVSETAALTNMIIMEVNLPSGFTSSDEFSNDLLDIELIERVESKNDQTTMVLYFEKLTAKSGYCFDILASKMHEVAQRKPALILIYDYYNISRHDAIFYSV